MAILLSCSLLQFAHSTLLYIALPQWSIKNRVESLALRLQCWGKERERYMLVITSLLEDVYLVFGYDLASILSGSHYFFLVQDWVKQPCCTGVIQMSQLCQEGKLSLGYVTCSNVSNSIAHDGWEGQMSQHTCAKITNVLLHCWQVLLGCFGAIKHV